MYIYIYIYIYTHTLTHTHTHKHAGTKPVSPALAGWFFTTELPGKHQCNWWAAYFSVN